ncbi:MAG: polyphosphate polymerase domain-containing protein [Clostridiales bacterium]|nr:polyphosphate polymerase domain-containing protein [Clostridiales bacterium]
MDDQYQSIFKRFEKKYVLSEKQYLALMKRMEERLLPDRFGKSTVCSLYFDTPSRLLIRRSLEKPMYKEKLRLRSYGTPSDESKVFLELKKKYDGVVYKRRIETELRHAMEYLCGQGEPPLASQIMNEIDWMIQSYENLEPAMAVSYDRTAWTVRQESGIRITFDSRILWRETELSLKNGAYGSELLAQGERLMELKLPFSMPLWLAQLLGELKIYPASFSKYGRAYIKSLELKQKGGIICA